MIRKGDTVMAAVSGGVDSVVLVDILAELAPDLGFTLQVCHLNHGLRGEESKRDFDFVSELAGKLGVGFTGATLKPGELKGLKGFSVQEAARMKRYEFFEEAAAEKGADRLALGHNLDDQAETVLMRFIKGSGLSGLAGIPPVRGKLIRPLIDISREDVESYAREKGLTYVEDASNRETKYLRNDIRHNLIPYIEKNYNPNIKDTLARSASVISRDVEFLRRQANGVFPELVVERGKDYLVLDRKGLMELHESLRSRVFLLAAEILKEKSDLYSYHVKSFLKVVRGKRPNASLVLPNGLSIVREYDRVVVSLDVHEEEPVEFDYRVRINGRTTVAEANVIIKTGVLKKRPKSFHNGTVAYFDYDALPTPLHVRTFRHGDRFAPAGMEGSHKKLKELFIEKKIPKSKRLSCPLLTAGGEIIWVVGIRRSELYQVTDETARILKVEFVESTPEPKAAPQPARTARSREAERRKRGRGGPGPAMVGQKPVFFEKPAPEEPLDLGLGEGEEGLPELTGLEGEERPGGEGAEGTEKPRRRKRPRRRSGRGRGKGREGEPAGEGREGAERAEQAAEEGEEAREKAAEPGREGPVGEPSEKEGGEGEGGEGAEGAEKPRRRRRPRRRSGRGRGKGKGEGGEPSGEGREGGEEAEPAAEPGRGGPVGEPSEKEGGEGEGGEGAEGTGKPRRRRRPRRRSGRGRGKGKGEGGEPSGEGREGGEEAEPAGGPAEKAGESGGEGAEGAEGAEKPRRRRRPRRRSGRGKGGGEGDSGPGPGEDG